MAVEEHRFTHKGKNYLARSDIADTDFGPEIWVDFYEVHPPHPSEPNGPPREEFIGKRQEPASAETIIGWWKESN